MPLLHDGEVAIVIGVEGSDSHMTYVMCRDGFGWIPTAFLEIVDTPKT